MKSTPNTHNIINTPSRNHHRPSLGFTLVELIVVITILVILATIAFTQFGSFQGSARDGDRVTTLKNIEKGLDVFQVKSGIYPLPEGEVSQGTINGSTEVYAYKGEIGDYVSRLISINKTPADPLSASHYAYALSGDKKTYQVATVMENTQAYNTLFSPITSAFAAQTSYQARVNGTYPGYIKFWSGAQTWIANIPSLIWSNSGETVDLLSTGTYFVVNRYTNLPYRITPDTVTENQPADILLQTITGQSNATLTGVNVTAITTQTQIADTFTGSVLASFAWVPGMEMNSPVSSHVMIMERIITGNATTGGSYIPTYLNCSEITQSWYTITPLAHATSLAFTKSITNGTGSLTATCTDGQLAYNPESVQCNATFVEWPNLTCIADVCGSTITDTNAHSTATSQTPAQSWHYDATPNICTYACNTSYTHNQTSQLCEPNNCTAGVQTYNTHTYSVPQLNHSVTGSVTSDPVTIPNGTQTFTTTYECSFWTATGITTEVANTPNCTTNFHYDTGTSACVSDTQTFTCTAKPATGTAWNSVSSYSQTWNGASYIPADSTTAYNVTPDTTSCRYKCDTGYIWNATSSLCEVKLYVDDVFNTYTFIPNGGTLTFPTGIDLAGNGGMVWFKGRTGTIGNNYGHGITDTTNGPYKSFRTNGIGGLTTTTNSLTEFGTSGITIGADDNAMVANPFAGGTNSAVVWTFRKAPKFFTQMSVSHVSGTPDTVDLSTLGQVWMVVMKRTDSTSNWFTWHRSQTTGKLTYLNTTAAETVDATLSVAGTNLTVASATPTGTYIVYAWAHDPDSTGGIIQCGSYATDVNATATVTLGWEPQWVLIKKVTGTAQTWMMYDTMRGWSMKQAARLEPNSSAAEANDGNGEYFLPTSSGFKDLGITGTNSNIVYCAIRRPNKPPTSGAQVYNASIATNNVLVNVGFVPDMAITKGGPGFDGTSYVGTRLLGNGTYLATTNSSAEGAYQWFWDSTTNYWKQASAQAYINHFFKRTPWVFDMVAYTGNGVARTVNHNLGVTPELIIVKNRGSYAWGVWHKDLSGSYSLELNTGLQKDLYGDSFDNSIPTSTIMVMGDGGRGVNGSAETYIAYLFATLPNISKVGSYSGNGTTQTINAGFSGNAQWARYILIKRTDVAGDWLVWDSTRGIVAGNDPHLSLNTTVAEVTSDDSVDPDATGFAVNQVAATNINVTGGTYIYLAIH